MDNQKEDLQRIKKFLHYCKFRPRMLKPPFDGLQKYFLKNLRVAGGETYLAECLALAGKTPAKSLADYRAEILADAALEKIYNDAVASGQLPTKYKTYADRFANAANLVNYYALMREIRPQIVVETGTAAGSMTSWLLSALEKNGEGQVISIDLPARKGELTMDTTVMEAGYLIPAPYKHRWTYLEGDAKILLPKVLLEHQADVFIHDSLHTRTHMLFEYNVARALLRPGAYILSDDILWNTSFFDFLTSHKLRGLACMDNPNLGLTVNQFDEYETGIGTGVVHSVAPV